VLEGTIHARVGGEELEAPPAAISSRRRACHTRSGTWGQSARASLRSCLRRGFERYFEEIEPVLRGHGPEFDQQLYAIAQQYQIEVLDDWSNELKSKYGLKL
jgi:hypothetical protein